MAYPDSMDDDHYYHGFLSELAFMWMEYAEADPHTLTNDALELRNRLREITGVDRLDAELSDAKAVDLRMIASAEIRGARYACDWFASRGMYTTEADPATICRDARNTKW